MKLTIVIPALNEQDSIAAIIDRCLGAAPRIVQETCADTVEVVVVSDGSTDRTVEIASGYEGSIKLVVFEKNRGYGAAIKEGWCVGKGDFLAFLDADGTCDPLYFIPMLEKMEKEHLDVVLGSRMTDTSRMPLVRKIGNTIFACMLGLFANKTVTDSASGMRIVRSSSLERLLPLPDGLHFTPAMSARALMDKGIAIGEVPMHYEERQGRSKLSVTKDGVRFFSIILTTVACLRPLRVVFPVVCFLMLVVLAVCVRPVRFYIANSRLEEWMVYRFILVFLLSTIASMLFCAAIAAEHVVAVSLLRADGQDARRRGFLDPKGIKFYLLASALAMLASVWLVVPGAREYWATGHISPGVMHWSEMIVTAFFMLNFVQFSITAFLLRMISSLALKQSFLTSKVS